MWEKVYVCYNKLRSFCFQATTFYISKYRRWQQKTFIIWRMAKINYRGMFSAFHYTQSMLTPSKSEKLSIHCLLLAVWTYNSYISQSYVISSINRAELSKFKEYLLRIMWAHSLFRKSNAWESKYLATATTAFLVFPSQDHNMLRIV